MSARTFDGIMALAIHLILLAAGSRLVVLPHPLERWLGWVAVVAATTSLLGYAVIARRALRRRAGHPAQQGHAATLSRMGREARHLELQARAEGSPAAPLLCKAADCLAAAAIEEALRDSAGRTQNR